MAATKRPDRPKLAVWKFSSCDGCQLSLLDCEDELLSVAAEVEIAYFLEATRAQVKGPYDISLVEGSITTPDDEVRIHKIRKQSKALITIGACATAGGIQALRNFKDVDAFVSSVYAHPEYIDTLAKSTAIQDHVQVDLELRGCPIDKHQLLEVLGATLAGRKPNVPTYSQCVECKLAGSVCVMVTRGDPCLGPVTQAGCGNVCPACSRACFGCFGPKETPNTAALGEHFKAGGVDKRARRHLFRSFTAYADAFRKESESHE
jgi:coenzyme F420-reducing hydrogenase gamma subunit